MEVAAAAGAEPRTPGVTTVEVTGVAKSDWSSCVMLLCRESKALFCR